MLDELFDELDNELDEELDDELDEELDVPTDEDSIEDWALAQLAKRAKHMIDKTDRCFFISHNLSKNGA